MALPDFSMRQLLEAGVHFGHQSHRWNPKMADYIFGARNNIHIIDLAQTVPLLHRALQAVSDTVAKGGRVLFVGTKRQAQDGVAEAAKRSAQYFVNSRWLGGTLTNWKTISGSIKRLRHLDEVLNSGDANAYTKKERLTLQRERDKLDRSLGGIKEMGGLPDMIFVIDTNKEDIAIQEAQRLNIPVAAIVDMSRSPAVLVPPDDDDSMSVDIRMSTDSSVDARRMIAATFPRMPVSDAIPRRDNPPAQFPEDEKADSVTAGEAVLRFVVDPAGVPNLATIELVRATSLSFARAAIVALPLQRFAPATIRGCPVAQAIDYSFSFVLPNH